VQERAEQCWTILYRTVQERAEQCWTIQDSAGKSRTVLDNTGQCRKEQNSAAGQYGTVQDRAEQCWTIQDSAGKSRTVLNNTGQCRKEQNSAKKDRTVQERAEQC
jgi:hypothetical protein